jgi:hypothetical protein
MAFSGFTETAYEFHMLLFGVHDDLNGKKRPAKGKSASPAKPFTYLISQLSQIANEVLITILVP